MAKVKFKPVKVKQHASKYNYTTRKSLGQKIKKFFTIPEEDLKEEESPKFEKIKLFRLNRGIIFLSILAFMLIVNLLIVFDVNFLYLRPILGFLFIILVPGLLIMLCFKIRTVGFWESLVYTVGLSVAFIMFAGLAVNWTLPALNITDKPLSLWPILICFNIFLLILWFIAIKRNRDLKAFDITIPKLDTLNKIFFIIPMTFPLLSILGAFLLNNHGPNILTMIMIGGIAVYVLFLVIFRKKLNENVWPWAILMISISLLLMFSLRGWYVNGWDSKQEQYVFTSTYNNKIWSMDLYKDAYNACLSLNILPTIINLFLNVNNQLIFKLFFQILFIFHSLAVFLIFRRYLSRNLAFISSFLYFGAGYFNSAFPGLLRQEIAFIFFGLMILVLFSKQLNPKLKKLLFIIFGASMIVSHYSTSYIALAMFTLTYIFTLIYKIHENQKIKKGKIHPSQRSNFYTTGLLIILLLIFGFLWLTQLTNTSDGAIATIKATYNNLGSTFTWDLKQSSVKGALFGDSKINRYTDRELNEYINETKSSVKNQDFYLEQQTQIYSPKIIPGGETVLPKNKNGARFSLYLYQFIKYLIILSFVLGSLFIYLSRKKIVDKEFSFMTIISVILMFFIILLPFISKVYGFNRLFQQCLIFLSFSSIIFFQKIFGNLRKKFLFFIIFIYLGYSLFNFGILLPISGGDPTLNMYNKGFTYNALYSHTEEAISIDWINKNQGEEKVYMDPYSELKFYSFGNPMINKDKKIIPLLMNKKSYIYSNYANKIKKINYWDAKEKFNNGVLTLSFPTEFLEENKNKVYNNGGSEIFK